MNAVANPISTKTDDLDAQGVQLSKSGGISSSYEMSDTDLSAPFYRNAARNTTRALDWTDNGELRWSRGRGG